MVVWYLLFAIKRIYEYEKIITFYFCAWRICCVS